MTTTPSTSSSSRRAPTGKNADVTALIARLDQMEETLAALQQPATRSAAAAPAATGDDDGQPPLYTTVEAWVTTYLLPTYPRPVGEVGMVRWHWCAQWWRHDEAVTRLTALWYGWEQARLEMSGMLTWLRELDHHLPLLLGDDGPFRNCSPASTDRHAQHELPDLATSKPAPADWWSWWDD